MVKALKFVLAGCGVLFLLMVAGIGWVFVDGQSRASENSAFASQFFTDLSANWSVEPVANRMTEDNVQQLRSPQGVSMLRQLASLGAFQDSEDFTVISHTVTTEIRATTVGFKARFAHGALSVKMLLVDDGSGVKIKNMMLNPDGAIGSGQSASL